MSIPHRDQNPRPIESNSRMLLFDSCAPAVAFERPRCENPRFNLVIFDTTCFSSRSGRMCEELDASLSCAASTKLDSLGFGIWPARLRARRPLEMKHVAGKCEKPSDCSVARRCQPEQAALSLIRAATPYENTRPYRDARDTCWPCGVVARAGIGVLLILMPIIELGEARIATIDASSAVFGAGVFGNARGIARAPLRLWLLPCAGPAVWSCHNTAPASS
jgi:hypothetical protein